MAFIVSTGSFRHTFMVMLSKKNSYGKALPDKTIKKYPTVLEAFTLNCLKAKQICLNLMFLLQAFKISYKLYSCT